MPQNSLQVLLDLDQKGRDFGFCWPNIEMIIDQIHSECDETQDALRNKESNARVAEEVGDILHAVICLCTFLNIDVHALLQQVSQKFQKRLNALEALTQEAGIETLHGQSIDFALDLWRKAKQQA